MSQNISRKISLFALMLLIVSAIDSNRNLPSSALFGSSLIFFFLFAAIFFFFPSALVSAELSAAFPEEGGIYYWVRGAFGEKMGMLAIWLQWINTVVWYPTVLSFIAGTLTYLIDPALMENKWYIITVVASIFWALTAVNLFGFTTSVQVNTLFVSVGTIFPMLLLIVLGGFWFFSNQPLQIPLTADAIFPSIAKIDTWTALEAVMGSFLGMELSGVHVANVAHPQKVFPKALLWAALYILLTMFFGSLTIALVLPVSQINLAGGLMQVFDNFFSVFQLNALVPFMSLLIVVGSIGGMINWLISPAKGLLHAAHYGFLPTFFTKTNSRGVASRILCIQAILVTFFCSVLLLLPTVNAFYWFLTALSNCLYMSMYILLFCASFRLRRRGFIKMFIVPGGHKGLGIVCLLGLIGSTLTILFGFVPPDNVNVGSPIRYSLMIALGNLLLIAPVFAAFAYKKRRGAAP